MTESTVTRRQLLAVSGAVVAGVLCGCTSKSADSAASFADLTPDAKIQALLTSSDVAAEIGSVYLGILAPESPERDPAYLRQLLFADIPDSEASFKEGIQKRIEQDFSQGDLCDIDGWRLSLTECRLGALKHLLLPADTQASPESGPLAGLIDTEIAKLAAWGPQETQTQQAFNLQPNGNSALWIKFDHLDARPYKVFFGEQEMITTVHAKKGLITCDITAEQNTVLTSTPREIPIHLVDMPLGERQLLGNFAVIAE